MEKFKDNENQTWQIDLNLTKSKKLREALDLDVLNPAHRQYILSSLSPRLEAVCVLCNEQMNRFEVSTDEFEGRLYGEGVADAASDAFLQELANFSRRLGQTAEAAFMEKMIELMQRQRQKNVENFETGRLDSELERETQRVLGELPESNGSESKNSQPSPAEVTGAT